MEHLNKLLKTALKQLGSNISEDAAQRIARAITGLEHLISNVDSGAPAARRAAKRSPITI